MSTQQTTGGEATTTTTGATTTATTSAQTTTAGQASTDWTSGLNDDLKGYVQNKGFKDPGAAVDAYRNLEKLMGVPKDRLLKLPEKEDDASWGDIYNRLGRPEKPEEYQLPVPQGGDAEFAKQASTWFHELGLSRKQAETLATKWNEYGAAATAKFEEQAKANLEQATSGLKKEWGAAYDQNLGLAKRAAETFGVKPEVLDSMEKAIGYTDVMKFMHGLAAKLGEDSFVQGEAGAAGFKGALTPAAAQSKIQELRQDKDFVRRYLSGEVGARQQMEQLHKYAHPESA